MNEEAGFGPLPSLPLTTFKPYKRPPRPVNAPEGFSVAAGLLQLDKKKALKDSKKPAPAHDRGASRVPGYVDTDERTSIFYAFEGRLLSAMHKLNLSADPSSSLTSTLIVTLPVSINSCKFGNYVLDFASRSCSFVQVSKQLALAQFLHMHAIRTTPAQCHAQPLQ